MCRPECNHPTPKNDKPGHKKMNDLIKKSLEKEKLPPKKQEKSK